MGDCRVEADGHGPIVLDARTRHEQRLGRLVRTRRAAAADDIVCGMDTTIDRDARGAKYAEERAKRLRADGNAQYVQPIGQFAHYLDDIYTERVERDPLCDEVTVAFIGGGFAGLVTGARLKQAGIDDVRIIEGGGDVGGAWYWNRYPGAMCDTAAMIYLPLLADTGYMPTHKYTLACELFGHARRIATQF